MQKLLDQKDEAAVEGLKITLKAVDAILEELLEEIKIRFDQVERGVDRNDISSMSAGIGSLARLAVQRQVIEKLRKGIPAVIIDGDVTKLRGVVG